MENITIGQIIAYGGFILTCILFTLNWFNKAYKARKKHEDIIKQIMKHDNEIKSIKTDLKEIKDILLKQNEDTKEVTICSLRATIWDIHRRCIEQEYVTKEDLTTFQEAVKVYEKAGGDDIVHTKLYPEVMELPVK